MHFRWSNQGNRKPLPRSNPRYLKTYYYIRDRDGKANKAFRKDVHFPLDCPERLCIVHYIGDESLSIPTAHGNAKQTKLFFRTKPSVLENLQIRTEVTKPHKVYKEMICENVEGHDATSKPRNTKQIQNARAYKKEEIRLSRDAILNTHALAYECTGFIHSITTFPDLCVVVGDQEIIEELNLVISSHDINLLCSYDTTFSLGDFYVSPLVFKHILFENNPIISAMFLIHERKLQETHDVFFKMFHKLVKKTKGIPIVTDMEAAIVNSIRDNSNLVQLGCWRHLRQDIQRWLIDHVPKADRNQYIDDIYHILRCESEEDCDSLITDKKEEWDKSFTQYFEKQVENKLTYFCIWAIEGKCKYDKVNGITTNQSEGFNFLLKDFQDWKEAPLDCILMAIKMLQGFYVEETRRGKAGLGTYQLKTKYAKYATDVDEFMSRNLVCHPKDIVKSLKNKEIYTDSLKLPSDESNCNNTRVVRAKLLVAGDCVSFSARLGVFSVLDSREVYTVKMFPKAKCTCPVKDKCIHILAVKLGLGVGLNIDVLDSDWNLGVVRKNAREARRKKPGRKQPRPGDVDTAAEQKRGSLPLDREESVPSIPSISPTQNRPKLSSPPKPLISTSDNDIRDAVELNVDDEMWVFSNEGVKLNLNTEDLERVNGKYDNGWLNDRLIDAAHALLRQEHNSIGGMQSCLLAQRPSFRTESGQFVQIVNTRPKGPGSHWLLLSTVNCPSYTIDVYDSTNAKCITTDTEFSLAKLMHIPESQTSITIRFKNSPNQLNSSDCGIYAIANMVAILNGIDPADIEKFDTTTSGLRELLKQYFELGEIKPFPAVMYSRNRSLGYTHVYNMEIFCSCRLPDLGTYFTCEECLRWFHPKCQGINVSQAVLKDKKTKAYCLSCHKGPGPQIVEGSAKRRRTCREKK